MIVGLSDRNDDNMRTIFGEIPLFGWHKIRVVLDLVIAGLDTFIVRRCKPAGII